MNEAECHMKNYGDRGGCYRPRRITPSEKNVKIILVMTNYAKNYASTIYQRLTGSFVTLKQGNIKLNQVSNLTYACFTI